MELAFKLHALRQHLLAMGLSKEIGLIKAIDKQLERIYENKAS